MFGKKLSVAQYYVLHKEELLKIFAHEQAKPITHAQLEQCFVDRNGKRYYRFPESVALPIERLGERDKLMMWMSAGLTASEQEMFFEEIDKALSDGLANKDKRASARIGSCIQQMRERRKMVIHTELLYNFLAVQWVREDEAPDTYNQEIQLQKVAQFKEEVAHSNSYFFFQQKELKRYFDFTNFTEAEWNQWWSESVVKQKALRTALEVYSEGLSKSSKEPIKETTEQ